MNRREFLKVASAGFGTLLVSGLGFSLITNPTESTSAAAAAPVNAAPAAGGKQNIVVITGSPHHNGTSALLADKFIEGAQSKGHNVYRFNSAFEEINPCRGCNACHRNGPCVHKDDIERELITRLMETDLVALISPVYYSHVSAQLKTLIDRFYSRTGHISDKKSVILVAAGSDTPNTLRSVQKYYQTLSSYMRWQSQGAVWAKGCATKDQILRTEYPQTAYDLGYKL